MFCSKTGTHPIEVFYPAKVEWRQNKVFSLLGRLLSFFASASYSLKYNSLFFSTDSPRYIGSGRLENSPAYF